MTPAVAERIMNIQQVVKTAPEYRAVWEAYEASVLALTEHMNALPKEQYAIIDEYIWAFFEVHMCMMEIALKKPQ